VPSRCFPPPWTIEEREEAFIVHDASGQALGYFCFEDEPVRQRSNKRLKNCFPKQNPSSRNTTKITN